MSNLVFRLPQYYQDSLAVTELERVLGMEVDALRAARDDTLAQLWVEQATWGLDLWERCCGLPVDTTVPYSQRRQKVLAKLRGQGTTTEEMIASVVASFGFSAEQVRVAEHPAEYKFEVIISDLAGPPGDVDPIEEAVNEIKPAHLDWWISYELAEMALSIYAGGGNWRVREVALPEMEA